MTTNAYTKDQTDSLVAAYKSADTDSARKQVVVAQATKLGRSTQSVIAKLSREGVYVRATAAKTVSANSMSKGEYVTHIAIMTGIRDVSQLDSLEKASKQALMLLSDALNKIHNRSEAK